jgi:glycine/D-amino acid oxidase-like deaminating enzyme
MVFDSKNFLYYFRLTADRRLLFGGRAEFTNATAASIRRAAEILRRGMVEVFPELSSAAVDYAWGGTVAFTRDQLPHAGRLGGMFFAGGYCGHGIAMATSLGALVGRQIAGAAVHHPLLDGRFDSIPLQYGKPWLLPLVGAYYRVKDWVD